MCSATADCSWDPGLDPEGPLPTLRRQIPDDFAVFDIERGLRPRMSPLRVQFLTCPRWRRSVISLFRISNGRAIWRNREPISGRPNREVAGTEKWSQIHNACDIDRCAIRSSTRDLVLRGISLPNLHLVSSMEASCNWMICTSGRWSTNAGLPGCGIDVQYVGLYRRPDSILVITRYWYFPPN